VLDPEVERLFAGLARADVERILRLAELRVFPRGATVLAQGDAPSGIYAIASGHAEVLLPDPGGGERHVADLGPGAIVGEISALTGEPISATVRAREDLEVRLIPLAVFDRLAREFPRLLENLGLSLASKLVQANRQLSPPPADHVIGVRRLGAPLIAVEALAASIAWHSRRRVALLVADAEQGAPALADASEGYGVDLIRVGYDDLEGVLAQTLPRYRHVLVVPLEDESPPARCEQVVTLLSPGAPADPAPGVAIRAPELSPADRSDVAQGSLPPESPAGKALGVAARTLLGLRVGLALGGGAIRGWAHFGVLRVFERSGIPLDFLAGTSSGAVVAALAAVPNGADEGAAKLARVSPKVFRPRLARGSLMSSAGMRAALREMFGERRFEDLAIPLAVTATDLQAESEAVLLRGPLVEALLASCAIPGIYPPQPVDGRLLVDGGILNPVPSNLVVDLGADVAIGVRLTKPAATVERVAYGRPGVIDLVATTFQLMQGKIASEAASRARILVEPVFTDGVGFGLRKFGEGRRYIEVGEAAAEEALPRIAAALPWLGSAS
jgi:NTE family protein